MTPGQTYYLEPIVQSGDDPWDVLTIGDTYANGQLYGGSGGFTSPFQPSVDFWFREGSTVPEPAAFALIGLAGLLILITRKHWRNFLLIAGISIPTIIHADTYYLQSYGGVGSLPLPMNPYGNSVPTKSFLPMLDKSL